MRARQLILNAVVISALGTMCVGQNSMAQTQEDQQRNRGNQTNQIHKQIQQIQKDEAFFPNTSIIDRDADLDMSKAQSPKKLEEEQRKQIRVENVDKMAAMQQTQQ